MTDVTQAAVKILFDGQWRLNGSRLEFGAIGVSIGGRSDRSADVKIGDKVRLIGIPPDLHDDEELQTRTLFEKCLGMTFSVAGLEIVEGLPYPLVQLDVGHILGQAPYLQTIWVEPEYLKLEKLQNSPPSTSTSSSTPEPPA